MTLTPLGWILLFVPLVMFLLKGTVFSLETNESFIREQWEKANRWLRNGKIDMEEFQVWVESDREFIGDDEWWYWMRKIRREKRLLYGKTTIH